MPYSHLKKKKCRYKSRSRNETQVGAVSQGFSMQLKGFKWNKHSI